MLCALDQRVGAETVLSADRGPLIKESWVECTVWPEITGKVRINWLLKTSDALLSLPIRGRALVYSE